MSQNSEEKSPNSRCSSLSIPKITSLFSGRVCSLSFLPNLLHPDASPLLPGPVGLLRTDVGGTEDRKGLRTEQTEAVSCDLR